MDSYSTRAFPIWLYFNGTPIGHATGFLWSHESDTFLVTNWHVVTGRDPTTLKHSMPEAAQPNRLEYLQRGRGMTFQSVCVDLYRNDRPVWLVHPEAGRGVDVVAIPITPRNDRSAINDLPQTQLWVEIGGPVFILGFPFRPTRRFMDCLPVWKRGTIASEPILTSDVRRYFLVDTASRKGMSGAPVIMRAHGRAAVQTSEDVWEMRDIHVPATRLVGIYSGRLFTQSPEDVQLGMVWPMSCVDEIVAGERSDIVPEEHELTDSDLTQRLYRIDAQRGGGEKWSLEFRGQWQVDRIRASLERSGYSNLTDPVPVDEAN